MAKATTVPLLPIIETVCPSTPEELADVIRRCYTDNVAVYPLGGETGLGLGLPGQRDGVGLSLTDLNRVLDYPARDMTITVEAGITLQTLTQTLAAERQRLPFDVPHADRATLGGVAATNFNGPRRYGHGTVRDYVIGVSAVDGAGLAFKGGGRVVKNVAGYDFCKLLTGSLGALGVITQLTLKVKPLPEKTAFVTTLVEDLDTAERLLAALVHSQTAPVAIELLAGPEWKETNLDLGDKFLLAVGFEGTGREVDWQVQQLGQEWRELGVTDFATRNEAEADALWRCLSEFPDAAPAALVLQASVVPSAVTSWIAAVRDIDPTCSVQAHAGNGAIIARLPEFPREGLTRTLIGRLQPAAAAGRGHVVMLSNPSGAEMTHQSVWGGAGSMGLMSEIKKKFDPRGILNPGRFI